MREYINLSNCPPSTATREDISTAYRLVSRNPITQNDFEPHLALNPTKNYPDKYKCIAAGTSVFEDQKAVIKAKRISRHLRNKIIAVGRIKKTDGLILKGNNHHITWWIDINNPQDNFKVIP